MHVESSFALCLLSLFYQGGEGKQASFISFEMMGLGGKGA
jgi:hypothetical protein